MKIAFADYAHITQSRLNYDPFFNYIPKLEYLNYIPIKSKLSQNYCDLTFGFFNPQIQSENER